MCCHVDCGSEHPKYKFSTADSSYCKVYEGKDKVKTSITINTDEIKKIFDNISNEQVELLGINAGLAHPRNYILTVIPVLPTCARPFVKADNNLCDDDLTNQYTEIIKVNNHLDLSGTDSVKDMSETKR
jgi:DNA-directed RNA polymerase beta' subunit